MSDETRVGPRSRLGGEMEIDKILRRCDDDEAICNGTGFFIPHAMKALPQSISDRRAMAQAIQERDEEIKRLRGIMLKMVREFVGVIWDAKGKNGTCVYCQATSPSMEVAVKHKSDCPIKQAMEVLGAGKVF